MPLRGVRVIAAWSPRATTPEDSRAALGVRHDGAVGGAAGKADDGAEPGLAHVVFPLEVDANGWPPVASERLWAFDLGRGRYRIDNVPWFVRDLAVGDIVIATAPDPEAHLVFQRLESRSDHLTIRLICFRRGPLEGRLEPVVEAFTPLGVWAEGAEQYGMVALDVPPTAPLKALHERLLAGEVNGSWAWEEGRITSAWTQATESPGTTIR